MSKKTISIDEQAFNIGGSPRSRRGRKGGQKNRASSPVNHKYKKDLLNKIKRALTQTAASHEVKSNKIGGENVKNTQTKNSMEETTDKTVNDYFTALRDKKSVRVADKYSEYMNSANPNPNPNPTNDEQQQSHAVEIISRPASRSPSPPAVISPPDATLKEYTPKPIPYGILKGGTKPTYRTWKKHHNDNQFNTTRKKYSEHKGTREFIENRSTTPTEAINIKKLETIRQLFNTNKPNDTVSTTEERQHTHPYAIVKTVKKTYKKNVTPGKNKATRKIATILSNNTQRSQIKSGIAELLNKPIAEIKRYLKAKNILTAGSLAPNVLMRQMYLQNYLCGGGCNVNREAVVENFISSQ